jgi:hypothetical protein
MATAMERIKKIKDVNDAVIKMIIMKKNVSKKKMN